MDKAPKIGQRVRYKVFAREEVTGTVEKIHKTRTYRDDVDWDDDNLTDADVRAAETGTAHEAEWKATVRIDAKPAWWPYGDHMVFCPTVGDLQPVT